MKRFILVALLFTLAIVVTRSATKAANRYTPVPYLLKDLDAKTDDSFPSHHITVMNGVAYFAATRAATGRELWRSNGTEAGTYLVKDIAAGSADSAIFDSFAWEDVLYFAADDGIHGQELWRSDGTEAGTFLLKNFSSDANTVQGTHLREFIAFNGFLYFVLETEHAPWRGELWRSDGTEAGTVMVHDLKRGAPNPILGRLTIYNDRLYLFASGELVSTDGTAADLRVEPDVFIFFDPSMVVFKDALYFVGNDTAQGENYGLWRLNQSGAHLFKDTNPTTGANHLTVVGEQMFFVAQDSNRVATELNDLWVTDGSVAGTRPLRNATNLNNRTNPSELTAFEDKLYFRFQDTSPELDRYEGELWMSDGTEAGTSRLIDLTANGARPFPFALTAVNDQLYFAASYQAGEHVWVSDGTTNGTRPIDSPFPLLLIEDPFYALNGAVIFSAYSALYGKELLITDDSTIRLTRDINSQTLGGKPHNIIPLDNVAIFVGNSEYPDALWATDGTTSGTHLLPTPSLDSYEVGELAHLDNRVYFSVNERVSERNSELWVTDGSADGTMLVKESISSDSSIEQLTATANRLFYAYRTFGQDELWVSDGTSAELVSDQWNDPIDWISAFNDDVFFSAETDAGRELWVSDGTLDGTRQVQDINTGFGDSNPTPLTTFDGHFYFSATTAQNGTELWISDGTTAGTQLVKDINTVGGAASSSPQFVASYQGVVYFSADDGLNGRELWVTDGTETGTQLFADLNAGGSSDPAWGTVYNGELYFVIDSQSGREIWRTDGDPATVTQVTNLAPNGHANPQYLTVAGDWLYFAAADATGDSELYRTDGETTEQMGEINPDGSADPSWLTAFNGKLLFQAVGESGTAELWAVAVGLENHIFLPTVMR